MTRRMLINALHPEEIRIAIAGDNELLDLEIERSGQEQLKGNIYKASISRIEPSLQAAFVDIGSNRNGFLQINDIHSAYFTGWPTENGSQKPQRPAIQNVLQAGTDIIVQVVKDERDAKGATLTTNLSIPGRFLVLMAGNQRGGVSRKISDSGQRSRLKEVVGNLKIPPGISVIVRTAGINKSSAELQADLDNLVKTWKDIIKGALDSRPAPLILYQERGLVLRTVRDYLTPDISEILVDEKKCFEGVKQFVENNMPKLADRLHFYDQQLPLFSKYHLDNQIDAIDSPEVTLPSGGSIVIDSTEAIVAIDVNSGRSTAQADVEETAFATNKEAAEEIAKQLRLRDLGGLVVIDFIDMLDRRHKQVVERTLKDAVKADKAKVEISHISKFGLLEMSRQRLKTSLASQNNQVCPYCEGRGQIKTSEAAAMEALRKIESVSQAGGMQQIKVRMAPAAALFLLNNKRHVLSELEQSTGISIWVYADGRMKQHQFDLSINSEQSNAGPSADGKDASRPRTRGSQRRSRGEKRSDQQSKPSRRRGRRRNNSRARRDNYKNSASTKPNQNSDSAAASLISRQPAATPRDNAKIIAEPDADDTARASASSE